MDSSRPPAANPSDPGPLPAEDQPEPSSGGGWLWIVLLLVVAGGGVAGGLYYSQWLKRKPPIVIPTIESVRPRETVPLPKVPFTDITQQAGIVFRHVNGAAGHKFLPETMGGGVAVFDFDGDGRQDILLVNSRPWPGHDTLPLPTMKLYRNLGDGKFADVTAKMGLDIPLYGMGACIGDYDNDGWPDVLITALGGSRLFHNEKGERFQDVTAQAGLARPQPWPAGPYESFIHSSEPMAFPSSATFIDYDGDGRLDLFICQYVTWSPALDRSIDSKLTGIGRAYVQPTAFEGAQCILYRNLDGRRFADVSDAAGVRIFEKEGTDEKARLRNVGKSLGVIHCDPDDDGWPDLIVANDTVRNFFFHNIPDGKGGRKFEEIGLKTGVAYVEATARGGMGIDWGEFRPGRFGVVIANFSKEPNTFLCLDHPQRTMFSNMALALGIEGPSRLPLKFGAFFFDLDLDGRLDLLTCNGHLEPEITKVESAQTFAQPAQVFWNMGGQGRCYQEMDAEALGKAIFEPIVGRGCAFGDLDGDGDLDVVLVANDGPALVLRNDQTLGHHWIRLTLEGDGRQSNRSAIGALVTIACSGQEIHRQVTGGRGYLSQSELPMSVGLGKAAGPCTVTVRWPGKNLKPQVFENLAIDKSHVLKQSSGTQTAEDVIPK